MNHNSITVERSDQKRGKQDAASRWWKVIHDQRLSGLSVSAFCRERGIPQSSLFAWRRRLRRAGGVTVFKPVKVVSEASGGGAEQAASAIELSLPGDRRLLVRKGFDRELLIELVQALEALA